MISVCIPSCNGAATLPALCAATAAVLDSSGEEREIIVVLDGSTDDSEARLQPLLAAGTVQRLIVLRRRNGQQRATLRALAAARGDLLVTLDDDFGHPPAALPGLLNLLDRSLAGGDLLFALPPTAGRSAGRNLGGRLRSALFRRVARTAPDLVPSSFRLFTRPCAAALLSDPGSCAYLSVELARRADRARSVPLTEAPGAAQSGTPAPSRHRAWSLVRSLGSLALYLPLFPPALRRLSGGLGRAPVRDIRKRSGTLLVVGAGRGQLGLIRRARDQGLTVAVSDRDRQAPGAALVPHFIEADTFDPPGTVAALRRAAAAGFRIDGAATAGTDQPVLTVAAVAEAFGLGGALAYPLARAVTDKAVMKRLLDELGLPTLSWRLVGPADAGANPVAALAIGGAAVVKPVDSQGQRGIFLVHSDAELFGYLPETLACSRQDQAMLERFYPAEEVTFSGWVHQGILYPLLLTDRATMSSGPHIGICPAHRYPSRHFKAYGQEILAICRRFVAGFGIRQGPVYVQLLVGAEGVVINEVAGRIGGAYEEVLVPRLTGVDLLDLQLELALEGVLSPASAAALDRAARLWPAPGYATVLLVFAREGRVRRVGERERLTSLPGVVDADYLLAPGAEIGPLVNSTGRAAWGIVVARHRSRINRRVRAFYDTLEVRGDSGENLVRALPAAALHRR